MGKKEATQCRPAVRVSSLSVSCLCSDSGAETAGSDTRGGGSVSSGGGGQVPTQLAGRMGTGRK